MESGSLSSTKNERGFVSSIEDLINFDDWEDNPMIPSDENSVSTPSACAEMKADYQNLPLPLHPATVMIQESRTEHPNPVKPERLLDKSVLSLFEQSDSSATTSTSNSFSNISLLEDFTSNGESSNVQDNQGARNHPNCVREENSDYNNRLSIKTNLSPPITLRSIPSGLRVDDRVVWVTETDTEDGTVKWIGKIRGQFYAGVELDSPVGNSSGIFGYGNGLHKRLFSCKLSYGRFIPVKELVLFTDYYDNGMKAGIICVICSDDFIDSSENISEAQQDAHSRRMVATKSCGHLFHYGCLNQWFDMKESDQQPCPYCQSPMRRNEVIRIFPTQF